MAVNPYEAAKNLGLGKGYSVGIMAKRPTMPRGPSGPALRMPSFKLPDLSVNLPSVNLKSPTFTQNFDPKVRTMYADDYDAFMANKASEAAKATNATTPGTPAVMGAPDATAPKPALGQGNLGTPGLGSSPALQYGGTDRYGNPFQPMGPVPRYTPYEIIDMSSEEKARDYIGRISDDEAKKIDPRGTQGLLDYLVESLKKRKIPQPPRQFPWRQEEQAPQLDWEAILDFQDFVGAKPGPYVEGKGRTINIDVDKALKNPGMADQSFGKSLTLKQVTPEMLAALKAEGYNVEQADYMKDVKVGMLKTESGSAALKLYKTLKDKGYDIDIQNVTRPPMAAGGGFNG
jgi:hypothetical protein